MRDPAGESSYDLVPYDSFAFPESHPIRLGAIGALYGMKCAAIRNCRVLELGCGAGGNLIPMAEQLPGARFVGIDLSDKQILMAQTIARELGFTNVRFEAADIGTFEVEAGSYDYIIAHGVYSWVPAAIRERVLEICARGLAEQGVAYVSYNTYPGWRLLQITREMMLYHARETADPAERLRRGRGIVDVVAGLRQEQDAYAAVMREEQIRVKRNMGSHVLHDEMERDNTPIYFHQFVSHAERKGLKYLGDSRFSEMRFEGLPQAVAAEVGKLGKGRIAMEQYLDFIRGNTFRRSALCRADTKLTEDVSADGVDALWVAAEVKPAERVDLTSNAEAALGVARGTLKVREPVFKAAMVELGRVWPKAVQVADLWRMARELTGSGAVLAEDQAGFSRWMLWNMLCGTVEFWAGEWDFKATISEKPIASPVARRQAGEVHAGIRGVTNRRHEMIQLDEVSARLLRELNGEHDREALTRKLVESAASGEIMLRDGQRAILDRGEMERFVRAKLDGVLDVFAKKALLVA
jgi:SAM-dependent methyltransferase/methyltransferase-like protein